MGLTNGGLLAREGIWKYTGAVPVMTGSGAQTPTRRQIEMLQGMEGASSSSAFPAYLRHMALVARDEIGDRSAQPRHKGADLASRRRRSRKAWKQLWGADVFDTYGCNECGTMASECHHKNGMHVFEDAFVMEVNDLETLRPNRRASRATIFITTLFKHVAPMIRYNMNDVTSWAEGDVRLRHASAQHHQDLRPQRQHGEASRRQCVSRGDRRDRRRGGRIQRRICLHPGGRRETGREDMTVMVETVDASVAKDGPGTALCGTVQGGARRQAQGAGGRARRARSS